MSEARIVLPVAEADDERRGHLHAHELVGPVGGEHDEGVGAAQPTDHRADGVGERAVAQLVLEQVRHHLGVGLRDQGVARLLELLPQLRVVLDDPVVDHGDPSGAVGVGVRVAIGRRPVGGPPRVAHRRGPRRRRIVPERGLELGELAGPPADRELPVREHGDTRRVVPPVLQPAQPGQDDRERLVGPDVADDAAHEGPSLPPGARAGQPSSARTTSAIDAAWPPASSSDSASTMTRTSASVPLARTSTRPRPPSSPSAPAHGLPDGGRARERLPVVHADVDHHLGVAAHDAGERPHVAPRRPRRATGTGPR